MTAILARLRTLPISRAVILAGVIVGAVVGVFAVGAVGVLAQGNKPERTPSAIITMEKGGEIVLDFYVKDAPRHVENFVTLAKKGFYDGQRVHRVEPNFVVQFGDPQSKTKPMDDPAMGSGGPG
jgi:Cyclophilin type peptidyl-prolyl cis-trans isomerase/CLD